MRYGVRPGSHRHSQSDPNDNSALRDQLANFISSPFTHHNPDPSQSPPRRICGSSRRLSRAIFWRHGNCAMTPCTIARSDHAAMPATSFAASVCCCPRMIIGLLMAVPPAFRPTRRVCGVVPPWRAGTTYTHWRGYGTTADSPDGIWVFGPGRTCTYIQNWGERFLFQIPPSGAWPDNVIIDKVQAD